MDDAMTISKSNPWHLKDLISAQWINTYGYIPAFIKKCSCIKFGAKETIYLDKHERNIIHFLAVKARLDSMLSKHSKKYHDLKQQLEDL